MKKLNKKFQRELQALKAASLVSFNEKFKNILTKVNSESIFQIDAL